MRKNIQLFILVSSLFFMACEAPLFGQSDIEKTAFTELLTSSFKKNNEILDTYIKNCLFRQKRTRDEKPATRPVYELAQHLVDEVGTLEHTIQDMSKSLLANVESSQESSLIAEGKIQVLEQQVEVLHNLMFEQIEKLFGSDAIIDLKPELRWNTLKEGQTLSMVFQNKSPMENVVALQSLQTISKDNLLRVLQFLMKKTETKAVFYDKFEVLATSSKPYVVLGETYEAELALGIISSTQLDFNVRVGGSMLPLKDGVAVYRAKPTSLGKQNYRVTISIQNPLTGGIEKVKREFSYEVVNMPKSK